jgi:cytosine/adenosine deaminase-related metal-dependent hydrolase
MAISLQARVVFPVDRPPIEHGFVTIEGQRIVGVGTEAAAMEVIDLVSVALLPALVNAHTHLEFSHLEQPLGKPGISLPEWIRLVIAERARGDRPADGPLSGLVESLRLGVTTIGNISTGTPAAPSVAMCTTHFHEVIGFSRARAESAMNALVEQIGDHRPGGLSVSTAALLGIQYGISPHSPYTVSPVLLTELVLHAQQHNMPMAMHVAESKEELELLRNGTGPFQELLEERGMWDDEAIPRGSRPLDYLRMLAEAPRALVIHGNYLDDEERFFLAANSEDLSLIHCPRTHSYFFHPTFPLPQLLASGVQVALGTDSRASTPDLDLLAEMRHVARLHPQIHPQEILRLGTLAGAQALGRADEVGSITPGKLANLVAIPIPDDAGAIASDLLAAVLADDTVPCGVWLRGSVARLSES